MEARSLASLNYQAGNPPQYPVNPAEQRQEPLTLYISRVPGTRDVILSPFKPQLKNVTAEDVSNSLYYVHLEMPSLDLSIPTVRNDDMGRSSEESPTTRNIPRKPLPGGARPITPERSPSRDNNLAPPVPEHQVPLRNRGHSLGSENISRGPPRWPAEDSGLGLESSLPEPKSLQLPELQAPMSQRPVGPRPPTGHSNTDRRLPPRPQGHGFENEGAQSMDQGANGRNVASRSPSPPKNTPFSTPFTLTLIRRDPGSGNQWNVGRISSYQTEAPLADQDEMGTYFPSATPITPPPASSVRPPINIRVDTLGYAKFRHMPAKKSMDTRKKSLDASMAEIMAGAPVNAPNEEANPAKRGGFSRQVTMSYSKSWTSNIRDKIHSRADKGGFGGRHHGRHSSVASVESTGSATSTSESGQPGPGMKPRGYVFTSPWDGRCEFRTGNGGRSLRCHHMLHDDKSSFNPLVAEQAGHAPAHVGSMPVSELRFNLPGADLFKSPDGRLDAKTQLAGHFNKLFKLEVCDDSDDDHHDNDGVVSPFDVNLGKEKAGGGNRGNRAKLGKLIVFNDGLKMLDLVVAANIGVWWGAWERSY